MSTDKKDDPIYEAFLKARIGLFFKNQFFGNIVSQMRIEDASDWCPTITTDGRKLYYNRDFVKSLKLSQLQFVISHQAIHGIYQHVGRRGRKDKAVWDMAIDYVTNATLVNSKIGEILPNALISTRFNEEMSADEVYFILKEENVPIQAPMDMHMSSQEEDEQDKATGGDGNEKLHIKGMPVFTTEQLEEIGAEVRAALISAASAVDAGDIPLGVRRLIKEITAPKMDWRELLAMHLKSAIKQDTTFINPSRRSWVMPYPMILPGPKEMEKIEVCVAIDTSGSMGENMLRDFLGEVKGIMEIFEDFVLHVMTFDTQVYDYMKFTPENISEIHQYPMRGGGGTLFEVVWDFLKKETDKPPEKLVVMTDGYPCNTWGDPDYCDTLFIVHGNNKIEAPFGMTAWYDDHD